MKTAFLYAGQGSQHKGMGEDLYQNYSEFREIYDSAELSFDLKKMCFEDKDGLLSQTKYTQPCMVAFAAGVTEILRKQNIEPDITAGLSLGEYSALCAAGVWDEATAIKLAAFRGEAMTRAAEGVESAMTAILGLDRIQIQECVYEASGLGVVTICNDNCPGQLVIGGEKNAVKAAADFAKNRGAKKCIPLNVSGPFHTSLMRDAGEELEEYFSGIRFQDEQIPVVFNLTGKPRKKDQSIQNMLKQQVQSGVRMTDTINYMLDNGVKRFVEIGPGKALTGFVKRCAKEKDMDDIQYYTVETADDIQKLLDTWNDEE